MRRRCYSKCDVRDIRDYVLHSNMDDGEKRVMLRLTNYLLDSMKSKPGRLLNGSDLNFEMLLLKIEIPTERATMLCECSERKDNNSNKRERGQDEHIAIQIAK